MKRNGAAGVNSMTWTSKYGSVVTAFYDVSTVDGINEQGLVANVLYLVESNYGKAEGTEPTLSIAAWAQYVLDNYATVAEAVEALKKEPFVIIAPVLPNGMAGVGHLALSDPTGDSAIFEYVNGKLLALNTYWEQIGGTAMLPGTSRASDRFARASFYVKAIPQTSDAKKAVASVFSLIRGVSVPLGITTPGQPNIASTVWRTLYDQKSKVVFFDSATSPTVFWAPLADLDFKEGAPVKELMLAGGQTYSGNASAQFKAAKPFAFLPATTK